MPPIKTQEMTIMMLASVNCVQMATALVIVWSELGGSHLFGQSHILILLWICVDMSLLTHQFTQGSVILPSKSERSTFNVIDRVRESGRPLFYQLMGVLPSGLVFCSIHLHYWEVMADVCSYTHKCIAKSSFLYFLVGFCTQSSQQI